MLRNREGSKPLPLSLLQLKLESSSTMLLTARSTTQRATLRVLPRSMWLARRPHKILQIADTEPGPKRSTQWVESRRQPVKGARVA